MRKSSRGKKKGFKRNKMKIERNKMTKRVLNDLQKKSMVKNSCFHNTMRARMQRRTGNRKNILDNFKIQKKLRNASKNKHPKLFSPSSASRNLNQGVLSPRTFMPPKIAPPPTLAIIRPKRSPCVPTPTSPVTSPRYEIFTSSKQITPHSRYPTSLDSFKNTKKPVRMGRNFYVENKVAAMPPKKPGLKGTTRKLFEYLHDVSETSDQCSSKRLRTPHVKDSQFFYSKNISGNLNHNLARNTSRQSCHSHNSSSKAPMKSGFCKPSPTRESCKSVSESCSEKVDFCLKDRNRTKKKFENLIATSLSQTGLIM
ncbi:unnamed protein product [Moneuplotes crassus]|uniref:Uncharacterized protein n=1 Tax=Euplotes crassus TaxID=5936 RepID=A0AAD2D603_EUPCR|nr:unnamed protein product [Moneuplotes crassus]